MLQYHCTGLLTFITCVAVTALLEYFVSQVIFAINNKVWYLSYSCFHKKNYSCNHFEAWSDHKERGGKI